MKFNNTNSEIQSKALEILNNAEDKSQAIVEVFEMLNAESHKGLIEQLQIENEQMKADSQYAEKMGLRKLSQNEKNFYEKVIAKQAFTISQGDIFPSEVIDRTLADVKANSDTLKLVNMAPAGVKKWLIGSHEGVAVWGGLSTELTAQLTASITSMNVEINRLHIMLTIPKAVRDLALPLVDRYFTAILGEAIHDGLVDGFLNGDGNTAPIGIINKLDKSAKDVDATITDFTPKSMKNVLKTLSNGGKRAINKLYLIANPSDVYEYVNPALYYMGSFGAVKATNLDIEVIAEPMCKAGKGIFTLEGVYTMGMGSVNVTEYKETMAVEDADLLIAKVYANGRADDDNTSYVFDATKLVEYAPTVKSKTTA